ncbi:hypothetical protein CIP107570_00829 [Corynebacterium diphtheriae]|nr:hypothetical protein CIP107570_00829 [Corynebacterium diphtheriae]
MQSRFGLYCRAHRVIQVTSFVLILLAIVVPAGHMIVYIPWLNGTNLVTINGVAGIAYGATPVMLFRNEGTRLELFSLFPWRLINGVILLILWIVPWVTCGIFRPASQFAYIATCSITLAIVVGQFLRSDTLILFIIGQFLLQTVMWQSVRNLPIRFIMFAVNQPPLKVAFIISVSLFVISLIWVRDPLKTNKLGQ